MARNLCTLSQKLVIITPISCLRVFSLEKTSLSTAHPFVF